MKENIANQRLTNQAARNVNVPFGGRRRRREEGEGEGKEEGEEEGGGGSEISVHLKLYTLIPISFLFFDLKINMNKILSFVSKVRFLKDIS